MIVGVSNDSLINRFRASNGLRYGNRIARRIAEPDAGPLELSKTYGWRMFEVNGTTFVARACRAARNNR